MAAPTASSSSDLYALVRTEFQKLQPKELLRESPRVLLGVTQAAAAQLLASLEIKTVFDLATSAAFGAATKLLGAGSDLKNVLAQYGNATSDMVREDRTLGKPANELQYLPIDALQGIPAADVPKVQAALDASTIRDLALWPPYRAAVRLLNETFFPENSPGFDPERPADLLPKTGEYPTERVQYTTLLIDEIKLTPNAVLADVTDPSFKPLNISQLAAGDSGFKQVAFGALLTFNQSWYAQGVTLGTLLHSMSLAPGESTRVAVVDWSRKSRGGETEIVDESDDLANDTSQNRSVNEVARAVAQEAQSGFSETATQSRTKQSAVSTAFELDSPFGGFFGGANGSVGTTNSTSSTDTAAQSYSSSFGRKDVGSSMMQNVSDRTHQHAHSARARRASVVKEVSQSEHENISTRVIANYNHCHSLNIHYYEMVQMFRTEVSVARADKVVFIPVDLADFNNEDFIRRFQGVLTRVAQTYAVREGLRNLDVIQVAPDQDTHFVSLQGNISQALLDLLRPKGGIAGPVLKVNTSTIKIPTLADPALTPGQPSAVAAAAPVPAGDLGQSPGGLSGNLKFLASSAYQIPAIQSVNRSLWSVDQASRLAGLLNRAVFRADSNAMFLPTDVTIEDDKTTVEGANVSMNVTYYLAQGTTRTNVDSNNPLPLSNVTRIAVTGNNSATDASVTVTLTLNRNGVRFPVHLPAVNVPKNTVAETNVVRVKPGAVNANLKQHLTQNRMYYSQYIFRSLDTTQIALLLSGYGIPINSGGATKLVPVSQVVDPVPIRYVGNYLAFKMTTDPATDVQWGQWMRDHGVQLGAAKIDLVPMACGGVFSEAVLGRSNCAEKLDITRFWKWSDAPIPLQPTEIAAIQSGSRATAEDLKPGQLSNPIINITTPGSLPDPTGTAAILAALQNGNTFRDMSGLQGTIALAQGALQATASGAAAAGQQAGTNMNNLLQASTQRQRTAAEMITSLASTAASLYTGKPGGGGMAAGGGSTHSEDGAKINYFDKQAAGAMPTGAGGGSTGGGSAAPVVTTGSSGGGGVATGGGGGGFNTGGFAGQQNPAALAATWGPAGEPSSSFLNKVMDKVGPVLSMGDPASTAPAPGAAKAWPNLVEADVLARIGVLAASPNAFDQGALGLCTAAAFYHHVLQRNPAEFTRFAKEIMNTGVSLLGPGKFRVAPGSDTRNAVYANLSLKFKTVGTGMPPQADWMLMAALRDSQNWFFDFEGAPDETVAIRTSAKEMNEWYEKSGFYTSVGYVEHTSGFPVAEMKAINKLPNNHISLYINTSLIAPGQGGTHIATLEGPLVVDEVKGTVTFDYWCWANPTATRTTVPLATMTKDLLGVTTATF